MALTAAARLRNASEYEKASERARGFLVSLHSSHLFRTICEVRATPRRATAQDKARQEEGGEGSEKSLHFTFSASNSCRRAAARPGGGHTDRQTQIGWSRDA